MATFRYATQLLSSGFFCGLCGGCQGKVASWFTSLSPEQAVWVRAQATVVFLGKTLNHAPRGGVFHPGAVQMGTGKFHAGGSP